MEIKQSKRGGYRAGAGRKPKDPNAPKAKRRSPKRKPDPAKVAEIVAAIAAPHADQGEQPEPKIGRPSQYKPEFATQAEKLCRLGATDLELANFFEVTTVTIWRWAHTHDAFCNALKTGKEACDERVERSLYHRAVGYSHDAVKIFMPANASKPIYAPFVEHVPPDVGAASLWLRNRRGEAWRDKQEHVHTFKAEQMTDDDLARIAAGRREGDSAAPERPPVTH